MYLQTLLSIINIYAGHSHTLPSWSNKFVLNTPRQGGNEMSTALIVMSRYNQAIMGWPTRNIDGDDQKVAITRNTLKQLNVAMKYRQY